MGTPKGTKSWNLDKGRGWITQQGYRSVSVSVGGRRRQVREHRYVMEKHLGRKLEPWEVVHHKDGDKLNNDLANLEIMTFGEHTAEHHTDSRRSYEQRRTLEVFANMREELKRVRGLNSELLEALKACTPLLIPGMNWTDETGQTVKRMVLAAIAKAEGR